MIGPWIEGPNGDRGGFLRYSISGSGGTLYNSALNKDPKKLGAIFEILDIFAQDIELDNLAVYGVEGEHYTVQEGGWLLATEGLDGKAIGLQAMRNLYGPELPLNDKLDAQNQSAPIGKWMREIQASYPGLAANVGYLSKVYTSLPSQSKYQAELMAYRDEVWLKIIQGTLPVDYYDTYVKEWNNKGGKVLTEEANAWYAEHK